MFYIQFTETRIIIYNLCLSPISLLGTDLNSDNDINYIHYYEKLFCKEMSTTLRVAILINIKLLYIYIKSTYYTFSHFQEEIFLDHWNFELIYEFMPPVPYIVMMHNFTLQIYVMASVGKTVFEITFSVSFFIW